MQERLKPSIATFAKLSLLMIVLRRAVDKADAPMIHNIFPEQSSNI